MKASAISPFRNFVATGDKNDKSVRIGFSVALLTCNGMVWDSMRMHRATLDGCCWYSGTQSTCLSLHDLKLVQSLKKAFIVIIQIEKKTKHRYID